MRAMILAAGRGERMRPLTDHCPKPLLEAGGRSLIEWTIDAVRAAGITDIVINHAHLGHLIEARLGDGSRLGVHVRYSAEAVALETAGGIRKALPLLGAEPFIVINGDVYCDADLRALRMAAERLGSHGDLAHLLLVRNPEHHPGGDFVLSGDRITASAGARLTFSGLGAYHPDLFAALPPEQPAPLAPLLREAIALDRVSGALHPGQWLDVGTPERLAQLDQQLRRPPDITAPPCAS